MEVDTRASRLLQSLPEGRGHIAARVDFTAPKGQVHLAAHGIVGTFTQKAGLKDSTVSHWRIR